MRRSIPFLLVALAACPAPEPPVPGVIAPSGVVAATLDGAPVDKAVFDAALATVPQGELDKIEEAGRSEDLMNGFLLGEALYRKAVADKLFDDPEVRQALALSARDVLAQKVVDAGIADKVSDAALQAAYEERAVRYAQPGAHVAHLVAASEEDIRTAQAAIRDGMSFAEAAAKYSIDKASGAQGGDIGWVVKGQLMPDVDTAVFGNSFVGQMGPMETNGYWFLIDVVERRDRIPFDEVKDALEQEITQSARQTFLTELQEGLEVDWAIEPGVLLGQEAEATPEPETPATPAEPAPEGGEE